MPVKMKLRPEQPEFPFPTGPDLTKPRVTNQTSLYTTDSDHESQQGKQGTADKNMSP